MKFRKMFAVILLTMFVFCLASCEIDNIPSGINKQVYAAGNKALEITDSYLNYEVSKAEAQKQIEEISDRLQASTINLEKDKFIESCVNLISIQLSAKDCSDFKIKESRNSLAKVLGKTNY